MNYWILFIAACFFYEENSYFGWNHSPNTGVELIADGMVLLLLAMASMVKK